MLKLSAAVMVLLSIIGSHQAAGAASPQWAIPEVRRGAAEIASITHRRLDYATTYRLARGHLEKNVHSGNDNRGFQLGAQLAITHWLAGLPQDTGWRPKALARHQDVTRWIAQDCKLALPDVAHAVALGLNLPKSEEGWLLGILKDEPQAPLGKQPAPPAQVNR